MKSTNPMRVPYMPKILLAAAISLSAGCDDESQSAVTNTVTPWSVPELQTTINKAQAGTALSGDTRFAITLERYTFDRDVVLTITTSEPTGPHAAAAVTPRYTVTYSPPEAVLADDAKLQIDFIFEPRVLQGSPGIARRSSDGDFAETVLPAKWTSEGRPDNMASVHGEFSRLGEFVVVDKGYETCHCAWFDAPCSSECGGATCLSERWSCESGGCIADAYFCDGRVDCDDGSDEPEGCTPGAPGPRPEPDSHEDDDTFEAATTLAAGNTQSHSFHHPGDTDTTRFILDRASDVVVQTHGDKGGTILGLFDAELQLIGSDDYDATVEFSRIEESNLAAGIYYVQVGAPGRSLTMDAYTLSLETTPYHAPLDHPHLTEATLVDGTITLRWDPVVGATGYHVYYDNDTWWPFDPPVIAPEGAPPLLTRELSYTITQTPAGLRYFISVTAINDHRESEYSATVSLHEAAAEDMFESDDTTDDARPIDAGDVQPHTFHHEDDVDTVFFVLGETSDVCIETAGIFGDTQLTLYDALGLKIGSDNSGGADDFSLLCEQALEPGLYLVKAKPDAWRTFTSAYTIALRTMPALVAPQVRATAIDGGVTLSWDAIPHAESYMILYHDSEHPFFAGIPASEGASPLEVTGTSQSLTGAPRDHVLFATVWARSSLGEGPRADWVASASEQHPDAYEPDDTLPNAHALIPGVSSEHSIHVAGDQDFFTFSLPSRSTVTVRTVANPVIPRVSGASTILLLYGGTNLAEILQTSEATNHAAASLVAPDLPAGDYIVKVVGDTPTTAVRAYIIDMSVVHAAVMPADLTIAVGPTTASALVSWSSVDGATAYRVWYDNDTVGAYAGFDALEGASPLSVPDGATQQLLSNLTVGDTYYFYVTALVGGEESAKAGPVQITIQ